MTIKKIFNREHKADERWDKKIANDIIGWFMRKGAEVSKSDFDYLLCQLNFFGGRVREESRQIMKRSKIATAKETLDEVKKQIEYINDTMAVASSEQFMLGYKMAQAEFYSRLLKDLIKKLREKYAKSRKN